MRRGRTKLSSETIRATYIILPRQLICYHCLIYRSWDFGYRPRREASTPTESCSNPSLDTSGVIYYVNAAREDLYLFLSLFLSSSVSLLFSLFLFLFYRRIDTINVLRCFIEEESNRLNDRRDDGHRAANGLIGEKRKSVG